MEKFSIGTSSSGASFDVNSVSTTLLPASSPHSTAAESVGRADMNRLQNILRSGMPKIRESSEVQSWRFDTAGIQIDPLVLARRTREMMATDNAKALIESNISSQSRSSEIRDAFDQLFDAAITAFEMSMSSDLRESLSAGGRIKRYVQTRDNYGGELFQLFQTMNHYFGVALTFDGDTKRNLALSALNVGDDELNCLPGTNERWTMHLQECVGAERLIMDAFILSKSHVLRTIRADEWQVHELTDLLEQACVSAAVNESSSPYGKGLRWLRETYAPQVAAVIREFSANGLQKTVDDFLALETAGLDVANIKKFQEKHTAQFQYLFPEDFLLHQSARHLVLGEDLVTATGVHADLLIVDFMRKISPYLTAESRERTFERNRVLLMKHFRVGLAHIAEDILKPIGELDEIELQDISSVLLDASIPQIEKDHAFEPLVEVFRSHTAGSGKSLLELRQCHSLLMQRLDKYPISVRQLADSAWGDRIKKVIVEKSDRLTAALNFLSGKLGDSLPKLDEAQFASIREATEDSDVPEDLRSNALNKMQQPFAEWADQAITGNDAEDATRVSAIFDFIEQLPESLHMLAADAIQSTIAKKSDPRSNSRDQVLSRRSTLDSQQNVSASTLQAPRRLVSFEKRSAVHANFFNILLNAARRRMAAGSSIDDALQATKQVYLYGGELSSNDEARLYELLEGANIGSGKKRMRQDTLPVLEESSQRPSIRAISDESATVRVTEPESDYETASETATENFEIAESVADALPASLEPVERQGRNDTRNLDDLIQRGRAQSSMRSRSPVHFQFFERLVNAVRARCRQGLDFEQASAAVFRIYGNDFTDDDIAEMRRLILG